MATWLLGVVVAEYIPIRAKEQSQLFLLAFIQGKGVSEMNTTTTSEAIAKRMRKRGYDTQEPTWWPDGTFTVHVWGRFGHEREVYSYTGDGQTLTAAYRDIEQRWKEEQADD